MRIQTAFVILLALLCLCRLDDLCGSTSRYLEASGLLSLDLIPAPAVHEDSRSAALREQKKEALANGIQTCVEVLMLTGAGICFFIVLRRSQPALLPIVA